MEPFLIRCPTCRSGLRVRRPEIIGQIIGCPKCSGMVLVARPSTKNDSAAPVNQQTTLFDTTIPKEFESTCDQIDHLLDSPAPATQITSAKRERWRKAKTIPPNVAADRSMSEAHAYGKPYTDSEMTPEPDWALKSKNRRKNVIAKRIFALATIGIIAAVGFSRLGRERNLTVGDVDPPADKFIASATPAPPTIQTEQLANSIDEAVSEDADSPPKPSVALASHQTKPTTTNAVAPVGHEHPVPEDNSVVAAETATNDAASELKPLDNFGDLFEEESDATDDGLAIPTRPTSAARPQRNQTLRNLRLPDALRASFKPAKIEIRNEALPAKPVDVQSRLADPIEDVRMNVGLSEMLRYISSMSTIPFTIRPEALRYSRITPNKITPIGSAKTTVAKLLSKGLAEHDLDIKADEGHVIVDRKKAVKDQIDTHSHNVADLLDAGVSGPELISIVKQLIDPFSWNALESPVEIFVQEKLLIIRHSESAHFQTMFLLERLRVARGMSLRGTMERAEFENDWQRTAKLTQPVALRTKQIDSLGSVIRKLDQLAGNEHHVIADWQSLAEQGWISISPFSAEIQRQPLATALPELLEPLGLTHRCVGPQLIEITTRAAESQRWELGFHSIGALTQAGYDPKTVVRQVETAIGDRVFRRGGGRGVIVYNDGAQSLLVRLPQSQQAAVDWVIKELERTL